MGNSQTREKPAEAKISGSEKKPSIDLRDKFALNREYKNSQRPHVTLAWNQIMMRHFPSCKYRGHSLSIRHNFLLF